MAMDVFYVSQWAAITKWCEAIGKDFQLLSDVAYDSLKTITNLRNENMALKKNINEADEVRLSLQKQVAIRNHKYEGEYQVKNKSIFTEVEKKRTISMFIVM